MKLQSTSGNIVYSDTEDHFKNGVLRLLNIDQETFERWLETSDRYQGSILEKLARGFEHIRPSLISEKKWIIEPGPYQEEGYVWHQLDNTHYVIRSFDSSVAWLARADGNRLVREINPPIYEESYFEGDPTLSGGYGEYTEQSAWRLTKAARQLDEIMCVTDLVEGKALDVGSGYGYFRHALEKNKFLHEGIEISEYACKMTKYLYGYDTFLGTLDQYTEQLESSYDLITMWDVIEHVADAVLLLQQAAHCLKPGGFLVLKTPNIDCPEAEILGSHFYSLKREHLVYFTQLSLVKAAKAAGLSLYNHFTISHFLRGFIGVDGVNQLKDDGRGADLVVYFRKD